MSDPVYSLITVRVPRSETFFIDLARPHWVTRIVGRPRARMISARTAQQKRRGPRGDERVGPGGARRVCPVPPRRAGRYTPRVKRALPVLALLALAGCGFHPVYATRGATAPVVAGLSQIDVALIPERFGQLTREALQARLEPDGAGTIHRFRLVTNLGLATDAIGVRPDSVPTHVRLIGTASWTLTSEGPTGATLAHGTARDVDGYDVIDQQYFAADLANEAVQRRIAKALASQIALQLALYFEKHPPPPT